MFIVAVGGGDVGGGDDGDGDGDDDANTVEGDGDDDTVDVNNDFDGDDNDNDGNIDNVFVGVVGVCECVTDKGVGTVPCFDFLLIFGATESIPLF